MQIKDLLQYKWKARCNATHSSEAEIHCTTKWRRIAVQIGDVLQSSFECSSTRAVLTLADIEEPVPR